MLRLILVIPPSLLEPGAIIGIHLARKVTEVYHRPVCLRQRKS